jgi:hypothetical protein
MAILARAHTHGGMNTNHTAPGVATEAVPLSTGASLPVDPRWSPVDPIHDAAHSVPAAQHEAWQAGGLGGGGGGLVGAGGGGMARNPAPMGASEAAPTSASQAAMLQVQQQEA